MSVSAISKPNFFTVKKPVKLETLLKGLAVESVPSERADEFGSVMVSGISAIDQSRPGEISFLQSAKYKTHLKTASASACLVPDTLAELVLKARILPILSATPKAHLARITERLYQPVCGGRTHISSSAVIDSTAKIGTGVMIGEGVHIGAYSVIGNHVHIGAGCVIERHVDVQCTIMGRDCHIKAGAVIGGCGFGIERDEQGLVHIPHIGRVCIGNDVLVGAQSCIDRAQLGETRIGDQVKIDNFVQIAHNAQIGARSILTAHVGISGSCIIGEGAVLGGNVGLANHVRIGDEAQIMAKSGVMHNIPAGEVWGGYPARPIREYMRMIATLRKLAKK